VSSCLPGILTNADPVPASFGPSPQAWVPSSHPRTLLQPHPPRTGSADRRTPPRRCHRRSRGAAPLRRLPRHPARGLGVPGPLGQRRRPRGWRRRWRARSAAAARAAAPKRPGTTAPAAEPSLRSDRAARPLGPQLGRRGRGPGPSRHQARAPRSRAAPAPRAPPPRLALRILAPAPQPP
jgi:hypothetical protein